VFRPGRGPLLEMGQDQYPLLDAAKRPKGSRLGQSALGASIARGTARDLFTQVTQQDSPPTPPAQHVLPHRLQPRTLRPKVIPRDAHSRRTGLQSHGGGQPQVLLEPEETAPGLVAVAPCPAGFLVVGLRARGNAEVENQANVALVDA